MRLIVPHVRPRRRKSPPGRSHASRERKRYLRSPALASRVVSRIAAGHLSVMPRVSPRCSAAPSRAVQRNDFNEAASITGVNRARALTGDLRPVGRAYASIQRGRTSSRSAARSHRRGSPDLDRSSRGFRRLSGRLSGNDATRDADTAHLCSSVTRGKDKDRIRSG